MLTLFPFTKWAEVVWLVHKVVLFIVVLFVFLFLFGFCGTGV
jgi:hypothetical protein